MDRWDPGFDRARPVFAPLARAIAPFRDARAWPGLDAWNASVPAEVRSASGAPIRFVPQPPRRRGSALDVASMYDERIYTRGEVPSRTRSWHDFFNMLVWVSFPSTKRAINARQRAALQRWIAPSATRLPGARTREQDELAMLDEGGLLLAVRRGAPALDDAIARADEEEVGDAIERGDARAFLLGHAIHEHLVRRATTIRALVRIVEVEGLADPAAARAEADEALARALESRASRGTSDGPGLAIVDRLFVT